MKFLLVIEIVAFLCAVVFVALWISGEDFEPWYSASLLVGAGLEIFRRTRTQRRQPTLSGREVARRDHEIVRSEFSRWCDQIRSVFQYLASHTTVINHKMFEEVLAQLRMHHQPDDPVYVIPAPVSNLIRASPLDFTKLQAALGRLKQRSEGAMSSQERRQLNEFVEYIANSEKRLLEIKSVAYDSGARDRRRQLVKAIENVSHIQGRVDEMAAACSS